MAGDGATFEIGIGVQAAGVDAAAASVARLTDRLTAAGSASTAAAEAVKAGEASYKQAERAAEGAARALEKIGLAAASATGAKLENLVARQGEAAAKAKAATAAMNAEAAALDKLKTAASGAAAAEDKVSKSLDKAKVAAGSGKVNEMAEGFGKLGGPLGSLGQKVFGAAEGFKKLSGSLGSAGPYAAIAIAVVAIAAAVVAATAAAIAGVVAIGVWAVGLADAARSQSLLNAAVVKSVDGGEALAQAMDDIEGRIPVTTDELRGLAKPLVEAGLKGIDLANALDEAAEKAAIIKLGPDFIKQMNSLPSLTARLQKNFARIFSGLKIDALLAALGSMVALFEKGSASATAISTIFESLFQPLIDGVTSFVPKMISAFIDFEILVMKAAIAIKPWGSSILLVAEIIGGLALVVTAVLGVALLAVLFSVGMLAVGFSLLIAAAVGLVAGVIWLGSVFADLGGSILGGLIGAFNAVTAWFATFSLADIGANIIKGLVDGILLGGPQVLSAITGIASGAVNAAKKALGIASPSTVFAEIGTNTAEGMSGGVDDSAGDVQNSLEAMVTPPDAKTGSGAGAAASGAGASGGNFTGAIFNFYGVKGAEDARDMVRVALEDLLTQAKGGAPSV